MSPSHVELTDFTGMDFALKKNCARPIAFSSSLDHFGAPSNDGKKIECTTPLVCLHIFNQWKDGRKRDRGRRGCIFRFLPLPTILHKWKKFVSLNEILVDVW